MKSDGISLEASRANGANKKAIKTISGASSFAQWWTRSRLVGERIRVFCEENDIRVIDLLDFIEGPDDMKRYLYASDGHFNPEGNRLVAQLIRGHILARR